MNLADLLNLGLEQTGPNAYRNFTLRWKCIHHPKFCEAIRKMARLHDRGKHARTAEGLLIVAQSGGGKTVLADYYCSQFPRRQGEDGQIIPVLKVTTPESPSVKTFAQEMLASMGDPAFDRGTAETKTKRLVLLLKQCGVELLVIDEFQHFCDGHRKSESRRVSDWLKNLLNAVGIPIVLLGLPRSISVLKSNPQLRRRFASPHYLRPFGLPSKEDRELRAVLKAFQSEIPVACMQLDQSDTARRLYFASNGLMDYLVKLIDEAVSTSSLASGQSLGMEHFARAFRSAIWAQAPDLLNPFCEKATLRPLMGRGEPFDNWDDPKRYSWREKSTKEGAKQ